MIRRDAENDQWILISQVEHARLAGLLAAPWGTGSFAALEPRAELVAAIEHHDDGWSAWEVAPKVDAETGRPLDFLETPLTDSLAIWRDSIEAAANKAGPLAGYMVSGHFSALLRRSSTRAKEHAASAALANDFFRQQSERQSAWLTAAHVDQAAAERAVGWLQLFDAISLWLCCAERREPETFDTPAGQSVTFHPDANRNEFRVSPWPFEPSRLDLTVVGRAVPAVKYASPSDLATAIATPATLRWMLLPGDTASTRDT
jgi:hypothetical protein